MFVRPSGATKTPWKETKQKEKQEGEGWASDLALLAAAESTFLEFTNGPLLHGHWHAGVSHASAGPKGRSL